MIGLFFIRVFCSSTLKAMATTVFSVIAQYTSFVPTTSGTRTFTKT